ncbi:MAG: hypothetical protein V4726_09740 [Verrucomicrobiota bacterium]
MTDSEKEAADHLRTIRALMERATVYRALSAPAALAGGVTALLVCGFLASRSPGHRPTTSEFMSLWLAVLAAMTAFNFWLLRRNALARGESFSSPGMRMALQAIAPPMAAGFVLSFLSAAYRPLSYPEIASYWMLFYGLGLLAMRSFAPRSLVALGGGFFSLGLIGFLPVVRTSLEWQPYPLGILFMALSFGLLHLIYAAAVFRARPPSGDSSDGAA